MRKVFAILDIETLTDARLAFDIAWILCDSKGNILERYNALVKDIFDSPFGMALLRRDSFIKNKSQMYIDAFIFHGIDVKPFEEIMQDFNSISKRYNAKTVMCAYNAKFDYNVLNDNASYIYGCGDTFFNKDVEIVDIMTMALATICDTNKYVRWCLLNGAITEKGNVKTNAQTVYGYLIDDIDFVEEHHALADCEIEKDIYFKARKRKQKHHKDFAMPMFRCPEWKQVQSRK
jgi:DNA polymerase III epsilon subunit-like protein